MVITKILLLYCTTKALFSPVGGGGGGGGQQSYKLHPQIQFLTYLSSTEKVTHFV